MSETEQTETKKIPFTGYVLFFALGLFLFFVSAFIVVMIRTKGSSKMVMPDLIGQNYMEIHNELGRLRLKVRLEPKRFPDKNDGEILYQSIPAGKVLEAGSKLYLSVNAGVDRIIVPDLKGQQLVSARALLEKVNSGDTYVNMEIGGITFVPVGEGQAPDTVIDQIPEAGKITTNREKIYLLVTESKSKDDSSSFNFENQPFPLVAYTMNRKSKPFQIKEILGTKNPAQSGLIAKSEKSGADHQFSVYFYEFDTKPVQSFEKLKFSPKESGEYTAKLFSIEEKEKPIKELFSKLTLKAGEEFLFIFYRRGNVRIDLEREGVVAKSFEYEAELKK